jgi:hypothetical protein
MIAPPTQDSKLAAFDAYVRDMERQGVDTKILADRLRERNSTAELMDRAKTLTEQLDSLLGEVAERAGLSFDRKPEGHEPQPRGFNAQLMQAIDGLKEHIDSRVSERSTIQEEPSAENEAINLTLSPEQKEAARKEVTDSLLKALTNEQRENEVIAGLEDITVLFKERLDAAVKAKRDELFTEPDEPEALSDVVEPEEPTLSPELRQSARTEVTQGALKALDKREPEAPQEEPMARLSDIPRFLEKRLDAMTEKVRRETYALIEEATGRKPT